MIFKDMDPQTRALVILGLAWFLMCTVVITTALLTGRGGL